MNPKYSTKRLKRTALIIFAPLVLLFTAAQGIDYWTRVPSAPYLRPIRRGDGIELRGATSGRARLTTPATITDYELELPDAGPSGTQIPTWSSAGFQGWIDPASQTPQATFSTYAALRAATSLPNTVSVLGCLAAGDGGGGTFVNRGATGSENGSTILTQALTGNKYHRVWDGQTFLLDWFQVGGVDHLGRAYDLTNNTGIIDASTQLVSAMTVVGQRGTVVGTPNRVYEFRRSNVSFGNWSVTLRNIRFKRANAINTTLAAQAAVGATSITVTDASAFKKGDEITIASGGSTAFADTTQAAVSMQITSVVGNVISFTNSVTRNSGTSAYPVGSPVFTVCSMIGLSGTGTKIIENCEFDGNVANNSFTRSWAQNESINIAGDVAQIRNCYFHDIPGENIIAYTGAKITGCTGSNLYGSFVHGTTGFSDPRGIHIENNTIKTVCLAGSAGGHNEGCFTWSSDVDNITIIGNTATDGTNACFSDVNGDDGEFICAGNVFRNFDHIARIKGDTVGRSRARIIDDNIFEDCGDLNCLGVNARRGQSLNRVRFTNNDILGNTRLRFFECENVLVENLRLSYATPFLNRVTQATSATTAVTLNASNGIVTTVAENIAAAGGTVTFTVNDSKVKSTSAINVGVLSGTTATTTATVGSIVDGSFQITLTNSHASTAETGTLLVQFLVFSNTLYDEVSGATVMPEKASIYSVQCDRMTYRNIRIEQPKFYCSEIDQALLTPVPTGIVKKDAAGTNTNTLWGQDMDFESIAILFPRHGLKCAVLTTTNWVKSPCGWRYNNIAVIGPPAGHTPSGTIGCGISIPPGSIARNLTFISLDDTNSSYWPMIFGGMSSAAADLAKQRGSHVDGYTLQGKSANGIALGSSVASRSNNNIVAVNGQVSNTTVFNATSGPATNYIQQVDIGAANLPLLTDEQPQLYQSLFENVARY